MFARALAADHFERDVHVAAHGNRIGAEVFVTLAFIAGLLEAFIDQWWRVSLAAGQG
jgi:hypothetical protein